jgi:hypothetical protein
MDFWRSWDLHENSKSGSVGESKEEKKKVMLPWMARRSWSRRESLKFFRWGGVGEEGLMQVPETISFFISLIFLCFLIYSLLDLHLTQFGMSIMIDHGVSCFIYRWRKWFSSLQYMHKNLHRFFTL